MRTRFPVLAVALTAVLVLVACGGAASPTPVPVTPAPPTAAPTVAPAIPASPTAAPATAAATPSAAASVGASTAPSAAPSPSAAAVESAAPSGSPVPQLSLSCAGPRYLTLKTEGKITISTDNPAFQPWWGGTPPSGSEWSGGYPPSGEGFESAIAIAIADVLGYTPDQIVWVPQANFGDSFKPGPKNFDFHLGQVSFSTQRAKAVDLSDSYYDVNQAVVALTSNPIAQVTTLAGLKPFKLGAAGNTTSFTTITDVIQPTKDPQAYDDNDKAVRALAIGQIDGLVVDLPTAFFVRDVQIPDAKKTGVIVGQIPTVGEQEHFSLVLPKGSAATDCVNQAIAIIKANGTWQSIYNEWLADKASAPVFQP